MHGERCCLHNLAHRLLELSRHRVLKFQHMLQCLEQRRHCQTRRRLLQHTHEVVASEVRKLCCQMLGHMPRFGEDGSVFLGRGVEYAAEPSEATRDIVELTGLVGRLEDATVLFELESAILLNEVVTATEWC